jgi:hypothetical protein
MKPALTVLTDPIPVGRFRLKETLKRVGRPLKDLIRPRPAWFRGLPYRGHPAVTRSLVEGLRKIGASANYNPTRESEVGEAVIVLSGIDALRQAIIWKREGRVARLLAGPNILVFPSEHAEVIAAPEVDYCVTPADWVCRVYELDCPALKGRCVAWPAGVDTQYWCPDPEQREPREVLILNKQANGPANPVAHYVPVLKRRNYSVSVVTHGSYTPEGFLLSLRRASLMVGFSPSESQGIAWAQAWSADVPTLLWFQGQFTWSPGRTFATSTAPYLCDSTGLFFTNIAEFEDALTRWETTKETFRPRRWVLDNMSDEVCTRQLCRLAGICVL